MLHNVETIEYKAKSGAVFTIRAVATRRDQSDMNIAMAEGSVDIEGGKIMTSPLKMMPWLVERFVVKCSECTGLTGQEILKHVYDQPADPQEDLIMVLGAYIFNHVKGLQHKKEDEGKKKG